MFATRWVDGSRQNEGRRPSKKRIETQHLVKHENTTVARSCLTSPFLKTNKNNNRNGAKKKGEQKKVGAR